MATVYGIVGKIGLFCKPKTLSRFNKIVSRDVNQIFPREILYPVCLLNYSQKAE